MAFISVNDVGVVYPIYSARGRSLKRQLVRQVGGSVRVFEDDHIAVTALENITMMVRSGDRIALIGGNGAGKSTLLRVLAGIIEPTTGQVSVRGRVSSLLDMSMGMDFEATGYENIIMRSVFLGASFAEARARVADIEEFSERGDYLGLPMRTYSTGMCLRLSFAIAMAMKPQILILDEMIGAGDAAFAAKAQGRMQEVVNELEILILATHDTSVARRMCTRSLTLSHGRVIKDEPIENTIA